MQSDTSKRTERDIDLKCVSASIGLAHNFVPCCPWVERLPNSLNAAGAHLHNDREVNTQSPPVLVDVDDDGGTVCPHDDRKVIA